MQYFDLRRLDESNKEPGNHARYHRDAASEPVARIEFSEDCRSVASPLPKPKQVDTMHRCAALCVPEEINACTGITIHGRLIKSFVFTTDVVTIHNCNADAVFAVYPLPCQPTITRALLTASTTPVFTGVGGSVTHGQRSVDCAMESEILGVAGVVLNVSVDADTIRAVAQHVGVIVVVTVVDFDERERERILAGAQIVNVAAGEQTAQVVRKVRNSFPHIPIMATSGKTASSIAATIEAGADALCWTPPNMADLEHELMDSKRALASCKANKSQSV